MVNINKNSKLVNWGENGEVFKNKQAGQKWITKTMREV